MQNTILLDYQSPMGAYMCVCVQVSRTHTHVKLYGLFSWVSVVVGRYIQKIIAIALNQEGIIFIEVCMIQHFVLLFAFNGMCMHSFYSFMSSNLTSLKNEWLAKWEDVYERDGASTNTKTLIKNTTIELLKYIELHRSMKPPFNNNNDNVLLFSDIIFFFFDAQFIHAYAYV